MDYGDPDLHTYSNRNGKNTSNASNNSNNSVPRPTFSGTIRNNSLEEPTRFPSANYVPMPAGYPYTSNANGYQPQFSVGSYGNYQTSGYVGYSYQQFPPQQPQSQQILPQYTSAYYPPAANSWNYQDAAADGRDTRTFPYNLTPTHLATKRSAPVSYEDISTPAPSIKRKRRKKNKNRSSQRNTVGQNPKNAEKRSEETAVTELGQTPIKGEPQANTSDVVLSPKKEEKEIKINVDQKRVDAGDNGENNEDNDSGDDYDLPDDVSGDDDDDYLAKQSEAISNLTDRNEPIPVPGTSITLGTEEDIAKWREERRKMWLLKISNNRKAHMEQMGVTEEELNKTSILKESKKQKQFIQNIQNQVNRYDPKANLHLSIIQRGLSEENKKLLDFIEELGDAGLLEYELTQEEKDKLFGGKIFDKGKRKIQRGEPATERLYKPKARSTDKKGISSGKDIDDNRDAENPEGENGSCTEQSNILAS